MIPSTGDCFGRNGGDAGRGPGVAQLHGQEIGLPEFPCCHDGKGMYTAVVGAVREAAAVGAVGVTFVL